jgi:hypothetical protein
MSDDGIELTREELYQKVWTTPATKLAREFGISDVALGKICRRMEIPKPPPGHWRKIETGHCPDIPPLPAPSEDTPTEVRIPPHFQTEQLALNDPRVSERLGAELLPENKIVVAETLADPHPLIARMLRQREERAPANGAGDGNERDSLPDIEASDESLDRALRIMDAVLKAVEARGYQVKVSRDYWEKATRVFCTDVDAEVQISLSERYSQVERELTPAERKKPPYLIDQRLITVPSGKLIFRVKGRQVDTKWWNDKKLDPLEKRLNEIVAGIITKLETLRLEELAKREAERRRLEDQKRREEEQARREKLHRDVAAWRKSEDIRAYLRAYEEQLLRRRGEITPGSEEDLWLKWARLYADSLDPLSREEG